MADCGDSVSSGIGRLYDCTEEARGVHVLALPIAKPQADIEQERRMIAFKPLFLESERGNWY